MNSKTAYQFTIKLLEKTKSHEITWNIPKNSLYHSLFTQKTYCYVTSTKQGEIILGKSSYDSSDYHLYIIPISGHTYDISDFIIWSDNDISKKYKTCIKELFEYVYNSLPNADAFIDSFLQN